jgi:hypothetical protein
MIISSADEVTGVHNRPDKKLTRDKNAAQTARGSVDEPRLVGAQNNRWSIDETGG